MPTQREDLPGTHAQQIGRWGEKVAENILTQRGCQVIGRNVRTPYGELDLIARQADELVFVEVKARTNRAFGRPEEAITPQKTSHLIQAAEYYLQQHPEWAGPWRIDVIAILGAPNQANPEIEYFENAIH